MLKVEETVVQSVDEVMIAYKGTRAGNLRQYIASKPDKWGFKFFARASCDGIIHDFIPYQGASTFDHIGVNLSASENTMNLSTKVVVALAKSMRKLDGSVIYADNFFTSYNLIKYLKKEYSCLYTGTARETRIGKPNLRSTADMNKTTVPREDMDFKSSNGVVAVKWKDNKIVLMESSASGVEPITSILRYDKIAKCKKEVVCPQVVKSYNANISGVDKSDMLCHLYRTPLKARRWYIPILGYFIDLSISNAWLVYKRHCKQLQVPNQPLKPFRLEIAGAFLQNSTSALTPRSLRSNPTNRIPANQGMSCVNVPSSSGAIPGVVHCNPAPKQGQRSTATPLSLRFDRSLNHLPLYSSQRLHCKFYSRQNNLKRTRWMCDVCKVALCLSDKSNCFRDYHQ